jgi:hypothetical protein
MPALTSPRSEAFAQALARGLPVRAAYVEAGYIDHMSNSATLQRNSAIQARVRELRSLIELPASAGGLTLPMTLMVELELARVKAMAEGQTSAAISAIMAKAKLHAAAMDPRTSASAQDDGLHIFDLSDVTDEQLAILEAVFGPLATAGAGDGGDSGGEGEAS